jgi:hypothetical protein
MIRSALVMALLATPAVAAPAHREPTPAIVDQSRADPARPPSTEPTDQGSPAEQARIRERKAFMQRQGASEARMKKTIGGICSGC